MQRYLSYTILEASKIASWTYENDETGKIIGIDVVTEDGTTTRVPADFFSGLQIRAGDYMMRFTKPEPAIPPVWHWMPRATFEACYRVMPGA